MKNPPSTNSRETGTLCGARQNGGKIKTNRTQGSSGVDEGTGEHGKIGLSEYGTDKKTLVGVPKE